MQTQALQEGVLRIEWVFDRFQVLIYDALSVIGIVRCRYVVNRAYSLIGTLVAFQHIACSGASANILNRMANKLCYRIVVLILACAICHPAIEWYIVTKMARNVDYSLHICIVILALSILLEQALLYRLFEVVSKEMKEYEFKRFAISTTCWEVE